MRRAPRVDRRAENGVGRVPLPTELRGVGLAHHDATGGPQALDQNRVGLGRSRPGKHSRALGGGEPGRVLEVLHRQRQSRQLTPLLATRDALIDLVGRGQRAVRVDVDERVDPFVQRLDAIEGGLDQLPRRNLTRPHPPGQLPHAGVPEVHDGRSIRPERRPGAGGRIRGVDGRRRSWWGWGWEGEGPNKEQTERIAAGLATRFGLDGLRVAEPARLEDLDLPAPRIRPPDSLTSFMSSSTYDRAGHTYGKAYRDVVRAFRGQLESPPDYVAFPDDPGQAAALLDWAADAHVAVIPYGGGSSVVGGVE